MVALKEQRAKVCASCTTVAQGCMAIRIKQTEERHRTGKGIEMLTEKESMW